MEQTVSVDRTHRGANPWLVLVVVCLGLFMNVVDTTIVNIALPNIIGGLHAGLDQALWVVNAYVLVYAVLLITAGRLGDQFGQRRLFAIGLTLFVAASIYCGLAPDVNHLIAARIAQGVGGAILTPQSLSILVSVFPAERRGTALGIWSGVVALGAIAGPTLGGFLTTSLSWRWIFFINVPVGIVALLGTLLFVPTIRKAVRLRLDVVGVALASLGLGAVVFGLIEGPHYHWGTIVGTFGVWHLIALGAFLLGGFVVWESRLANPLMPLHLFRDRNFSVTNGVVALVFFGMLGLLPPFVIYLQNVLHLSALQAGLTLLPWPLAQLVTAPLAGRFSDRLGARNLMFTGLLLVTAGLAWLVGSAAIDSHQTTFVLPYIVVGLGFGAAIAPATGVAMRNIQPRMAGAASGVFNTTRQLGAVMGTAVVGAVLQNEIVGFGPRGYVAALQVSALIPVAAVFMAAVLAIGIGRRRRAEPSTVEAATTEIKVA